MFQETTFVLIGQPQFSIFDKSCIFIGCYFKQIIKKFTGSKSKDSINLTAHLHWICDLDLQNVYFDTKFASNAFTIGQAQAKFANAKIYCIFGSGHFEKNN